MHSFQTGTLVSDYQDQLYLQRFSSPRVKNFNDWNENHRQDQSPKKSSPKSPMKAPFHDLSPFLVTPPTSNSPDKLVGGQEHIDANQARVWSAQDSISRKRRLPLPTPTSQVPKRFASSMHPDRPYARSPISRPRYMETPRRRLDPARQRSPLPQQVKPHVTAHTPFDAHGRKSTTLMDLAVATLLDTSDSFGDPALKSSSPTKLSEEKKENEDSPERYMGAYRATVTFHDANFLNRHVTKFREMPNPPRTTPSQYPYTHPNTYTLPPTLELRRVKGSHSRSASSNSESPPEQRGGGGGEMMSSSGSGSSETRRRRKREEATEACQQTPTREKSRDWPYGYGADYDSSYKRTREE